MQRVTAFFRIALTVLAMALSVEVAYRLYLLVKYPANFRTVDTTAAPFSIWNRTVWRYSRDYGYEYFPARKVDSTAIEGGLVTVCAEFTVANEQGNFGPPVFDYDEADVRVAIFGDSFTGPLPTGTAWTKILGENLERELGKTVRVMNMGRDGYGMPQMIALANGKLKDLRPSVIVFAFNGPALERARYWRTTVGTGDDVRLYSSIEDSSNPDPGNAADTSIVMASATRQWCEEQIKKSPDEQRGDPILQKILIKHREIAIKNGTPQANLFDLKASYAYDMIRYRNGFYSQWRTPLPSTNPLVTYEDYRDDPIFMAHIGGVIKSGIPYIFAHLALGKTLSEGREFDLSARSRNLMESLRRITGAEIYRTSEFVSLSREDALRLCYSTADCHPSEYGHKVYANVVTKMLLKSGFR
jgi:hypothetical protein